LDNYQFNLLVTKAYIYNCYQLSSYHQSTALVSLFFFYKSPYLCFFVSMIYPYTESAEFLVHVSIPCLIHIVPT